MNRPEARVGFAPRAEIESLSPYWVRREADVKLNQNESPLDWPEEVKAEVLSRLAARSWNRYPASDAGALRAAFAAEAGVTPEMVAVANGSNEAMLALVEAFGTGRGVVLTSPGYSMSRPLAVIGGARVTSVPLRADFSLDSAAVIRMAEATDAALVFLASPNNPTGNAFARQEIERVLAAECAIVAIDEAYVQFAEHSYLSDIGRYPHLVVLRTCSKAFALAAARVGWIVARQELTAAVQKALPPYNISIFAQEAALAALARQDVIVARVQMVVRERERLATAMASLGGITVYPSETNFLLFRTPLPGSALFARLLRRGVLVRDVSDQPLLEYCLRVTVGTAEENDRFIDALQASLEDET